MSEPLTAQQRKAERHAYREYDAAIKAANLQRAQRMGKIRKRTAEKCAAVEQAFTEACMLAQKEAEDAGIVFGGAIDE